MERQTRFLLSYNFVYWWGFRGKAVAGEVFHTSTHMFASSGNRRYIVHSNRSAIITCSGWHGAFCPHIQRGDDDGIHFFSLLLLANTICSHVPFTENCQAKSNRETTSVSKITFAIAHFIYIETNTNLKLLSIKHKSNLSIY